MKLESHCLAIRSRQSRAGWKPAPTLLMHQSGECRYPWDAFLPKCRAGWKPALIIVIQFPTDRRFRPLTPLFPTTSLIIRTRWTS